MTMLYPICVKMSSSYKGTALYLFSDKCNQCLEGLKHT